MIGSAKPDIIAHVKLTKKRPNHEKGKLQFGHENTKCCWFCVNFKIKNSIKNQNLFSKTTKQ